MVGSLHPAVAGGCLLSSALHATAQATKEALATAKRKSTQKFQLGVNPPLLVLPPRVLRLLLLLIHGKYVHEFLSKLKQRNLGLKISHCGH